MWGEDGLGQASLPLMQGRQRVSGADLKDIEGGSPQLVCRWLEGIALMKLWHRQRVIIAKRRVSKTWRFRHAAETYLG